MKMLVFLLLAALFIAPSHAQETGTAIEPSPVLMEQLTDLEITASELRGLEVLEPVNRYFPSRAEVAEFLTGQFADETIRQSLIDYEIIYKAFGVLPQDIDLLAVYQTLLESQVGGYYDPETKRMNTLIISTDVLGDSLPLLEQIVYVHEYVHALQDQHYDLDVLLSEELALNEPDHALAIQSLVEGDATQIMTDYLMVLTQEDPIGMLAELETLTGIAATQEIPAGTPDILTQELTFPYLQGQAFVQALVAEGGYAAVDAAFLNPPVSSEQIIHPDKYLAGELPIAVTLADNSAVLGEGWTLAYDRTAGEYFLRNWLRPGLSALTMPIAASGWGGDRYHLYTHADGQVALVWRIVFDTPTDDEQFVTYLPDALTRQYGAPIADEMCWAMAEANAVWCFSAHPDGGVVITRAADINQSIALLGL